MNGTGRDPIPPTALYCGSNSDRQSVGLPGHCEPCARIGHVAAHPDLGCGDVGCAANHGDDNEWTLTISDDGDPERLLPGSDVRLTEPEARVLFLMVLAMVNGKGNKREGDACSVTLYAPDGSIAERYERAARIAA